MGRNRQEPTRKLLVSSLKSGLCKTPAKMSQDQQSMTSPDQESIISKSQIMFEDMPQMPETTGFLEIFQEMMGLNLISEEWMAMGTWTWIAIIFGTLGAVGLLAGAAWGYWQNKDEINDGITAWFNSVKEKISEAAKWIKKD